MDKRSLRRQDINRANGHHTFGIAEKVMMPAYSKIIYSRQKLREMMIQLCSIS